MQLQNNYLFINELPLAAAAELANDFLCHGLVARFLVKIEGRLGNLCCIFNRSRYSLPWKINVRSVSVAHHPQREFLST